MLKILKLISLYTSLYPINFKAIRSSVFPAMFAKLKILILKCYFCIDCREPSAAHTVFFMSIVVQPNSNRNIDACFSMHFFLYIGYLFIKNFISHCLNSFCCFSVQLYFLNHSPCFSFGVFNNLFK